MLCIYILRCPVTKEIKYIGKTVNLEKRFHGHLSEACFGTREHHRARWLRKLWRQGAEPECVELFKIPPIFPWQVIERFFIASARHFGFNITNSTAGGDGVDVISEEVTARMSKAAKLHMLANPESFARFRAAQARWLAQPENKKKLSVEMKARHADKEMRERMYTAQAEAFSKEEVKAARKAGMKEVWARKGQREHHSLMATEREAPLEKRALRSETAKARWADPTIRAKQVEAVAASRLTPEFKKNMKKAQKALWANPEKRAARIAALNDPEVKARHSASLKAAWVLRKKKKKRIPRPTL